MHVDVLASSVRCSPEGCTCDRTIDFRTILDWYANLYYHLDNRNLIEFETLVAEDDKRFASVRRRLNNLWKSHVRLLPFLYRSSSQWKLKEETIQLFRQTLEEATNAEHLLLTAMGWLLLLDEALRPLRDELRLRRDGDFPITTIRGPLVFKCESPFLPYLSGFSSFRLPIDPNYLTLRNKLDSFHLAKERYPYYKVEHRYLPLPSPGAGDPADFAIGFLPGKFRVDRDYRYKIDKEPNDDGMLPFSFAGLRQKRLYETTVRRRFVELLDRNPDVIMLPELMTPLALQQELKELLGRKAADRAVAGERHRTALLLTGSFHVRESDLGEDAAFSRRIYNYAQVVDGMGETVSAIYKMNRFVLERDPGYEGELAPFRWIDGVETNAYDKREIVLWDTSWGRMAVLICVDFLNADLAEVLLDRQVDLLFLMTMTRNPAGGKFLRRMQEFGERNNAIVVACNHLGVEQVQEWPYRPLREHRIVVYLPGFSRVFTASDEAAVYRLGDIADRLNRESSW